MKEILCAGECQSLVGQKVTAIENDETSDMGLKFRFENGYLLIIGFSSDEGIIEYGKEGSKPMSAE